MRGRVVYPCAIYLVHVSAPLALGASITCHVAPARSGTEIQFFVDLQ